MQPDLCLVRHRYPVRVSDGKYPWYICAWCGERWAGGRNGNVPKAPPSWERMTLAELQVWYARVVIKARI